MAPKKKKTKKGNIKEKYRSTHKNFKSTKEAKRSLNQLYEEFFLKKKKKKSEIYSKEMRPNIPSQFHRNPLATYDHERERPAKSESELRVHLSESESKINTLIYIILGVVLTLLLLIIYVSSFKGNKEKKKKYIKISFHRMTVI